MQQQPGVPLPLPPTYRVESRLIDEGLIVPCPRGVYGEDWEEEPVELDGETYLRLGAVDLDNPKAIFGFVEKFGPLGGQDLYVTFQREAAFAAKKRYGAQLDTQADLQKKRQALREEQAQAGSIWPSEALALIYTETLGEFRFAARCLRDLTAAWRIFKDGTAASDVQWVSPQQLDDPFLQEDGFPTWLLEQMLPRWFLNVFSPHLTLHYTPPLTPGPAWHDLPQRHSGLRADPLRPPVGGRLFQICALELYNHIVENANYLICANENCQQRNFVHQQGHEKNWHRSKGVLYCSYHCAHAVAQRRYRRKHSNQKRTLP